MCFVEIWFWKQDVEFRGYYGHFGNIVADLSRRIISVMVKRKNEEDRM